MHFPGEGAAVYDLKSKVLIRLGAMKLPEPDQVRLIELIDDSVYDVLLMNNRSLRDNGDCGNEQSSHRREFANGRREHDKHIVI